MKLSLDTSAPSIQLLDINQQTIELNKNSPSLLVFLNDIRCPWAINHLNTLHSRYSALSRLGLNIIVICRASEAEIKHCTQNRRYAFSIVSTQDLHLHQMFSVQQSLWRKNKTFVTRFYDLICGLKYLGLKNAGKALLSFFSSHNLPANFLIDESGLLVDAYYGKDAGDYMPMQRVEIFLTRCLINQNPNFSL